jgi:hypothetical protein
MDPIWFRLNHSLISQIIEFPNLVKTSDSIGKVSPGTVFFLASLMRKTESSISSPDLRYLLLRCFASARALPREAIRVDGGDLTHKGKLIFKESKMKEVLVQASQAPDSANFTLGRQFQLR